MNSRQIQRALPMHQTHSSPAPAGGAAGGSYRTTRRLLAALLLPLGLLALTAAQAQTLGVTKTSSAGGGPVAPGDTISYTVTVQNTAPPGSPTATGVTLSDTVPTGTSYVAESTVATGPASLVGTLYTDGFESDEGWTRSSTTLVSFFDDWISDPDDPDEEMYSRGSNNYFRRAFNLDQPGTLTLEFWYRRHSVDNNDYFYVLVTDDYSAASTDCTAGWTQLGLVVPPISGEDLTYQQYSATIPSPAAGSATAGVCFKLGASFSSSDRVFVDDLHIFGPGSTGTITLDNDSASPTGALDDGTLPSLVTANDGFQLAPGEILTVTFDVQVNDSIAGALTEISNQATADSDETASQDSNTVTDSLSADFTITKTLVTPPAYNAGDSIVYTLEVENLGGATLSGAVVSDTPTGVTIDSVSGAGCSALPCTLGALASGATATITVNATIDGFGALPPGTFSNAASVSAPGDFNPANDTSETVSEEACGFGQFQNRVWVTSAVTDTETSNNQAIVCTDLDTPSVNLSGNLFNDTDGDPNVNGTPISAPGGTQVYANLVDVSGNVVAATPISGGSYAFNGIDGNSLYDIVLSTTSGTPGSPAPAPDLPVGWVNTGENLNSAGGGNDGSSDGTLSVAVGSTNVTQADFGIQQLARIGDLVWFDADGDGNQDTGESGVANVVVNLLDATGTTVIATTTTDASGAYEFTGLAGGSYNVEFVPPSGFALTVTGGTAGPTADSDPDPATGILTAPFFLAPGANNDTIDAGLVSAATIGNYVWLDEDGDGDQDAGEAGIPNVTVQLYDATGATLLQSTTTDADGGYLFHAPANVGYVVRTVPPAGMSQTYDENGPPTDNQSAVSALNPGQEHMSADFGYNWVPPASTNSPPSAARGAIGDFVWIDANGDGVQEPGEAGLADVGLVLVGDTNGDGIVDHTDQVLAVTTTDASGHYIFPNLPAGPYQVMVTGDGAPSVPVGATAQSVFTNNPPSGYTQTGDPDGTASLDNQTTTSIVLAPGDVFVNADFGYQPGAGSDIGDTIYFDSDGDGQEDPGEPGIPGVTVTLLDDSGNPIATTVTDDSGAYLFPGLPAGTYSVWVNDTENVLGELLQTGDPDGGANGSPDGRSTTTVDGTTNDLDQDHGYAPPGHGADEGLIGDTIFLDRNGNDTPDAGEGLEGVTVELYDATGTTLLATTVTDENGNYSFGALALAEYQVQVDTLTLPNMGVGLTNSVDPQDDGDSTSNVTLAVGSEVNLAQDFGYVAGTSHTIGGTLWEDTDADGTLEGGEDGRFGGVTVVLRDSGGDIVATTTTDGTTGYYQFTGLPAGTYTVDVTDESNVLNGYWHSDGPNDNSDNNSQIDPYTVTVSGGVPNETGDFGYYAEPASIGDRVWYDTGEGGGTANNGMLDGSEPGIEGVLLTLTITYPNGDQVVLTTRTDDLGRYSFENLMLDEDYSGSGAGQPTYSLVVGDGTGTNSTHDGTTDGNEADNQADNPAGEPATPTQGSADTTNDFAFNSSGPTVATIGAVELRALSPAELLALLNAGAMSDGELLDLLFGWDPDLAAALEGADRAAIVAALVGFLDPDGDGQVALLRWETLEERGTIGFYAERNQPPAADWFRINHGLLPGLIDAPLGGQYMLADPEALGGIDYLYRLLELEAWGTQRTYGPYELRMR